MPRVCGSVQVASLNSGVCGGGWGRATNKESDRTGHNGNRAGARKECESRQENKRQRAAKAAERRERTYPWPMLRV